MVLCGANLVTYPADFEGSNPLYSTGSEGSSYLRLIVCVLFLITLQPRIG